MSSILIGTGSQAGLKVSELVQNAADTWGGNVSTNRFNNMVKRMINQVLGDVWRFNPTFTHYRLFNQAASLIKDQSTYDVRKDAVDGGFGWTACFRVETLVFVDIDQRPLERLSLEQFRERSELLASIGSAESWFPIRSYEIVVFPTPDRAYDGRGDYIAEIPSITQNDSQIDWARSFDYIVGLGVDWKFARMRHRRAPAVMKTFKDDFYAALEEIDEIDKTAVARPQRAMTTRHFRSGRQIPTDNSTDRRYYY